MTEVEEIPIIARTMAEASLPKRLDAQKMIDNEQVLTGSVESSGFERLADAVESVIKPIDYRFAFNRDIEGTRVIDGTCATQVSMVCQRCLKPVELDILGEFQLGLAFSDDEAKHLPKRYEPALMDENGNIDPWELLEDELLLALPMFANHADGECAFKQPEAEVEQIDEAASKKDNPFDVLKQLKSK